MTTRKRPPAKANPAHVAIAKRGQPSGRGPKLKLQLGPTPSVPGSRLKGTTKPKGKR